MKFKDRKLYSHGQNTRIFIIQIPKLVCEDMDLQKDDLLTIDYEGQKMVITKQEKVEQQEPEQPKEEQ